MTISKGDFTKAKRYTFFHTAHTTTFDGSETQHVKTNFTASVDGNHEIKADKIILNGPTVLKSTASINGNVKIGGDLYITGSMIVTSSVNYHGSNTFGDAADDNQKLIGTTTASGNLNVNASLKVNKNASIDGTLKVGGKLTAYGKAHLKSTASIDGSLNVKGNAVITGSLKTDKNASIDKALKVGGKFTVYGTLHAKSTASIDGNLNVAGNSTVTGSLIVENNASINGNLAVGGTVDGVDVAALQLNVTDANASVTKLKTNMINANASISAVNAWRLIKSEKITVGHVALINTASQYVKIHRASPGDTLFGVLGNLTAAFSQTATPTKRTKIAVGDVSDIDGYAVQITASPSGWKWTSEALANTGVYFKNASGGRIRKAFNAGTNIRALFTASDMLLASLNKGSIDFYLDIMSRA